MPKDFTRIDRVAGQIRRELAEFIRLQVNDPRVKMVTLTDVEVARDYSHAKIFYTTLNGANKQVQQGLERASGFLRSQLAHSMKLRITPQLHFVYDPTVESGARLSQLIDQAIASDHQAMVSDYKDAPKNSPADFLPAGSSPAGSLEDAQKDSK